MAYLPVRKIDGIPLFFMGLESFSYLIKLLPEGRLTKEKIGRKTARPGKSADFVQNPCAEPSSTSTFWAAPRPSKPRKTADQTHARSHR
jgi:hypothetical protein